MSYEITATTEKHIEGFWNVFDGVAKEREYLAFLEAPPIETTREFIREQLQNDMPHFVALIDGAVVGWCDISSLGRAVYAHAGVLGMGVSAKHRGKGIGKSLMQATLEKAKKRGLTRVELEVREKNTRAMEMYKKFGFVMEGMKRNSTRIDGVYSNDVLMGVLL